MRSVLLLCLAVSAGMALAADRVVLFEEYASTG